MFAERMNSYIPSIEELDDVVAFIFTGP